MAKKDKDLSKEAKYNPEMATEAYRLKSEHGYSNVQVAANLKISREQLNRWAKDVARKPEFAKALARGEEAAEAYHELRLQELASGNGQGKGNVTAAIYYMRCRFKGKWQQDGTNNSKVEIEHKYSGMTPEQLQKYVQSRLELTKTLGITIEGKCSRVKHIEQGAD